MQPCTSYNIVCCIWQTIAKWMIAIVKKYHNISWQNVTKWNVACDVKRCNINHRIWNVSCDQTWSHVQLRVQVIDQRIVFSESSGSMTFFLETRVSKSCVSKTINPSWLLSERNKISWCVFFFFSLSLSLSLSRSFSRWKYKWNCFENIFWKLQRN